MRARANIASRIKAAQKANGYVAAGKGLERRRGLVNFLTWAFVLGEALGRDGLLPSAHAAGAEESSLPHGEADVAPLNNAIADRPVTSIGDPGETPTTLLPGSTHGTHAPQGMTGNPEMGSFAGESVQSLQHGGGDVGVGGAAAGLSSGALASPPSEPDNAPDGETEQDAPVGPSYGGDIIDLHVPPLIDVSVSAGGLIKDTFETIHALPVVGELASDVGAVVRGLAGDVAEMLGPQSGAPLLDGVFASGGLISFGGGAQVEPSIEVSTPQGFTDYGIALELDLNAAGGSALSAPDVTSLAAPLLDFGHDGGQLHISGVSNGDHGEEAGQRASADVL